MQHDAAPSLFASIWQVMGRCLELSLQRDGVADGLAGGKVMQVLDGDVEDVLERDR